MIGGNFSARIDAKNDKNCSHCILCNFEIFVMSSVQLSPRPLTGLETLGKFEMKSCVLRVYQTRNQTIISLDTWLR